MAETSLLEKREAFEAGLLRGDYRTLTDVILDGTGRGIQRLLRRARPAPYWISATVIALLMLAVASLVSLLLGEEAPFSGRNLLMGILGVALGLVSLMIFKAYVARFLASLRSKILDSLISADSLGEWQGWLNWLCNPRAQFLFSLVYGLALGAYITRMWSETTGSFIGYGPALLDCLVAFVWGLPMYFLLVFLFLPARMGRSEYHLYRADPSSSEIIAHFSGLLKGLVYLYAVVAAGSMVFIAYAGFLLPSMVVLSILVAWLPIIVLFVSGQAALAKVVRRAKWQTLNEIQAQVEQIQVREDLAGKETMEGILRLMDYHERVKATKSSTLDLRAGLGFLNSLLLPLLGFVLGNIESLKGILAALFAGR
ncbi:MAG: hypothetical protein FJ010_00915 [Chloroflexi bacterium]|nr:hypothetical protein [Chloroflexota bacterium]